MLLSIGFFTPSLVGNSSIAQKQMIIANVLFARDVFFMYVVGEPRYFPTSFLILLVGIAIIRLKQSWSVPPRRIHPQKLQKQARNKNNL
ncbi:hypothetical protein F3I02_17200 [Bacillus sp. SRB3LM]|nr:hypothetical protein [Bacillus sp. SRB3LM]